MRMSTAAALIRDDIVTVNVCFGRNLGGQECTFLCKKGLAETLELGDSVLVWGNKGYVQIATVCQVDKDCEVDVEADFKYGWIFQIVNISYKDQLIKEHEKLTEALEKSRKDTMRRQALQSLGIDSTEVTKLLGKAEGSDG